MRRHLELSAVSLFRRLLFSRPCLLLAVDTLCKKSALLSVFVFVFYVRSHFVQRLFAQLVGSATKGQKGSMEKDQIIGTVSWTG